MTGENSENPLPSESSAISKKPFIEPEVKEFDDLEKQIGAPLVGAFTP